MDNTKPKQMKIIKTFALALLPAALLSSCLSSGSEPKDEATYTYGGEACFNYVTDLETGDVATYQGVNYSMRFDYTGETVKVDMTNLKLSSDLSGLSFKLPELPLKVDQTSGLFEIKGSNLTPENVNASSTTVFDKFTLRSNPSRMLLFNNSWRLYPIYLLNYTINNRYEVACFPVVNVFVGTTVSRYTDSTGSPKSYTDKESNKYVVQLNHEKKTADISFYDMKFGETLPTQSFMIKGVPVKFNNNGFTITPEADTVYKLYYFGNGKEIEGCSLTNLRASSTLTSGVTAINFTVDLSALTMSYQLGVYDVSSSLGFYFPVSNDNNNGGK